MNSEKTIESSTIISLIEDINKQIGIISTMIDPILLSVWPTPEATDVAETSQVVYKLRNIHLELSNLKERINI